ncbi:MAG TPA: glycoside hydrolase family 3 N-terminal domain-containing protein [Sphingobium sp.]|uniref:glycoside hydrolase family 3 N-terminal domain-containing protein n=1 Tax=Sphingobium sp. TaxID=1912891 RepID=UPI002ED136F6
MRDLLGRMTLEEKVAQLQGNSTLPPVAKIPVGPTPAFGIVKKGVVDEVVARRALGNGLGAFVNLPMGPMSATDGARAQNAIQSWVIANTRLGIPILFQGEALHGAVITGATNFPQVPGLGSTWNPALIRTMFDAVGRESRAAGFSMVLAPVFDLARDARFGRVEEMYSEDPYLVGEMGLAAVQGLQGSDGAIGPDRVIATAKHFIHGQPESGNNTAPSDYSERTMRSVFMAPFEKAVKVGGIAAIMPSYNENRGGIPGHSDDWLLKDVLRRDWGFKGITTSDWFAISQLATVHHIAADQAAAGVLAFNAGVDMEAPNGAGFASLADAVRSDKVALADIDAAVARVLTLKFRAGLFERPLADDTRTAEIVGAPAHAALARKVADEAVVLLKNEGALLPLDPKRIRSIAVIGPNADKARIGGYAAVPANFVTVLDGIRKRVGSSVRVTYAEGVRISQSDKDGVSNKVASFKAPTAESDAAGIVNAVATAREADVVLLVLGDNETVTREAFSAGLTGAPALGDTDDLRLPGRQDELVREIVKLGKPTAAVLLNGRPRSIEELSATVPAILEGWYAGQETGSAVAGILFGDVNPSGRLPVTIARNAGQMPAFYYHTPQARLGYVGSDNSPLYPFGFGLSYTNFSYGKPVLDRTSITRGGTARLSVTVTNTGKRAGAEVVQLYVHPQVSSVVQPVLRLAGFRKVAIEPGKARTVTFDVGPEQLTILDRQMKPVVEAGKVDMIVGSNVRDNQVVTLEVKP